MNQKQETAAPVAANDNHQVSKEVLAHRQAMAERKQREASRIALNVSDAVIKRERARKRFSAPYSDDELPTTIPPEKEKARQLLAELCAGVPVTICPAQKPVDRQSEFRFGRAANNNQEPKSWPLAKMLRQLMSQDDNPWTLDQVTAAIEICELYRGIWAVMAADPLAGKDADLSFSEGEVSIETETCLDGYEKGKPIPEKVEGTGELTFHGVRQAARSIGSAGKMTKNGDADSGERYATTAKRFNERTLIAQIDLRGPWRRLQAAIRPIRWAFEMACLDSATMTEIGEARGYTDKRASAVGKALVLEAIAELQVEWLAIHKEQRAAELNAESALEAYRADLTSRHDQYMGRAA
ncbi:hypothetical protein [Maritalea sp. S77]|uniref:hypothetical protein n=1 Tax=Maritalea sp. S77 TaxID=3415125 RepID=UPI003C7E4A8C